MHVGKYNGRNQKKVSAHSSIGSSGKDQNKRQNEEISIHFNYTTLSIPMLSKRTKAKHLIFPMKNRLSKGNGDEE